MENHRVLRPAGSCIARSRASDPDSQGRISLGLRASFSGVPALLSSTVLDSRDTVKEAGSAPLTRSSTTERDGVAKAGTRVSVRVQGNQGEIPRAEGARVAE